MKNETISKPPGALPPTEKEPGPLRLIATLGVTGFFSGLFLVGVYLYTLPLIESNQQQALEKAVYLVLPGSVRFEALVLDAGKLVAAPSSSKASKGIYAGYAEDGRRVGFAIPAQEPGYQDVIVGLIGYDPVRQLVIGFEVLESKETPGLGDKIIKDQRFRESFLALATVPPPVAVKPGEKRAPNEVEAITGATISSKAVLRMVAKALEEWSPPIADYQTDE